ncbi:hypothetical protein B7P43_G15435 [Cryptotermes secundus]|uniref:Uncharacterized protein n=1 Tax=Cryptotermes secundus TaxID=105785 RepID=A0A2J7NKE6_9NEOP|nr:hypothetical protein B7P43_G15435 [Cryptotermes secundus]
MDRKPEVAQQREVPVEDATVMAVGEPKRKRRRDRKLVAERCRQEPKDRTREKYGSQKRLAVARRWTGHRAKVARQKENVVGRNCTIAVTERATQRVGLFRKNFRTHHEGKRGTKDRGGKRPLYVRKKGETMNYIEGCGSEQRSHLESGETSKKTVSVIFRGNIAKQVVCTSSGLRKIRKCTLLRGGPPPKRKKKQSKQRRNR